MLARASKTPRDGYITIIAFQSIKKSFSSNVKNSKAAVKN